MHVYSVEHNRIRPKKNFTHTHINKRTKYKWKPCTYSTHINEINCMEHKVATIERESLPLNSQIWALNTVVTHMSVLTVWVNTEYIYIYISSVRSLLLFFYLVFFYRSFVMLYIILLLCVPFFSIIFSLILCCFIFILLLFLSISFLLIYVRISFRVRWFFPRRVCVCCKCMCTVLDLFFCNKNTLYVDVKI